jgi:hypothetical protein
MLSRSQAMYLGLAFATFMALPRKAQIIWQFGLLANTPTLMTRREKRSTTTASH